MLENRAIVVHRDTETRDILTVDAFHASDLTTPIIYTNGPSVQFIIFGDLAAPDLQRVVISGNKVELNCQTGMIVGVSGNSFTTEPEFTDAFLNKVKTRITTD